MSMSMRTYHNKTEVIDKIQIGQSSWGDPPKRVEVEIIVFLHDHTRAERRQVITMSPSEAIRVADDLRKYATK